MLMIESYVWEQVDAAQFGVGNLGHYAIVHELTREQVGIAAPPFGMEGGTAAGIQASAGERSIGTVIESCAIGSSHDVANAVVECRFERTEGFAVRARAEAWPLWQLLVDVVGILRAAGSLRWFGLQLGR